MHTTIKIMTVLRFGARARADARIHQWPRLAATLCAAALACSVSAQTAFTPLNIGGGSGTFQSAGGGFNATVTGTNILGTADQFAFNYQQLTGDFDFRVRVATFSPSDAWAKAGLMARETLNADSRFAAALASPNVAGSFFESRANAAASATVAGNYPVNYPYTWLRLRRVGNVFTGIRQH
jgi:hypothetical protein